MSKVKITLIRSLIDRPGVQKRTVKALGLGKISSSREHEANPAINGMIRSVAHLLKIEEI